MAGKMEPEEAFRLIDPRGVKHRAIAPGEDVTDADTEDKLNSPPPKSPRWLRITIISMTVILTLGFFCILASGVYLLYNKKEPAPKIAIEDEALFIFSKEETRQQIETTLKAFLNCSTTKERLQYILSPAREEYALRDYYDRRGNLDSPLWKIKLIKAATLDGSQLWMVAYLDVTKKIHYVRFERSGNAFYIQWTSSYGYGELPWNEFARTQPSVPIQMRCYILRHTGMLPPGIDPDNFTGFVIENKRGEFTATAIMHRQSKGFHQLANLPNGARSPVHLTLKYTDTPNGTRQLTIDQLLHFQWHQNTTTNRGRPVKLRR